MKFGTLEEILHFNQIRIGLLNATFTSSEDFEEQLYSIFKQEILYYTRNCQARLDSLAQAHLSFVSKMKSRNTTSKKIYRVPISEYIIPGEGASIVEQHIDQNEKRTAYWCIDINYRFRTFAQQIYKDYVGTLDASIVDDNYQLKLFTSRNIVTRLTQVHVNFCSTEELNQRLNFLLGKSHVTQQQYQSLFADP